jgi:Zn-dependent oligopeptidase
MMFEQWVYDEKVLERLSGHHADPSRKLPAETIAGLVSARYHNSGYGARRFIAMALFDLEIHSQVLCRDYCIAVPSTRRCCVETTVLLCHPLAGAV